MAFKCAIVLTGSIATGKSSVAKILAAQGYTVIDADSISHEVLDEEVIQKFDKRVSDAKDFYDIDGENE